MTTDPRNTSSRPPSESGSAMARPTSLTIPNPDVFSDDYAIDGSPDISPVNSVQHSAENLSLPVSQPRGSLVSPHTAYAHLSRPASTSKRPIQDGTTPLPNRAVSLVSRAESLAQRTSSTSSRFSIPRAQSPFLGTTGPSHPYGMYPQVTRASSIASESTTRPMERPFIAPAGPEHPYSMYPQNVVPEEENAIPLGFPGMGRNYQTRTAGHDVADIVGVDGHVEELPPYTRYAENMSPKLETTVAPSAVPPPLLSPISQDSDSGVELNVVAARDAGEFDEKKTWKQKAQRRVCAGLPLWALILILLIVVFAAVLGGAVGTALGIDRGTDIATSAAAESNAGAAVSTTTMYLDATPIPTATALPDACPTGNFNISVDGQAPRILDACVAEASQDAAWQCMFSGVIDIEISPSGGSNPIALNVSFPAPSLLPAGWNFGAQPPAIMGSNELQPFADKDDGDPALFFWTYYNKIVILPVNTFVPASAKPRSLAPRDYDYGPVFGDIVWQCVWQASIIELFIYPNNSNAVAYPGLSSSTSTSTSISTPTTCTSTSTANHFTFSDSSTATKSSAVSHTWSGSYASSTGWDNVKRQFPQPDDYPKKVRIVEKRNVGPNPPTICKKMQVLYSWQLGEIPNNDQFTIRERDFSDNEGDDGPGGSQRRDLDDTLQSFCACEYYNS